MIGKGLESLIPPKAKPSAVYSSAHTTPPAPSSISPRSSSLPPRESPPFPSYPKVTQSFRENATAPHSHFEKEKKRFAPESIFHIEIERIKPNPYQPRQEFRHEKLEELAQSVREFGILQPLVVSKIVKETDTGTEVEYQLIAGERRLKAAKIVGLERVPAIVKHIGDARTKLELALIENIQRSDLNALEAARAYARLQDEFGLTQREIAMRVGKSREVVANTLRLLQLPLDIQEAISRSAMSESQGRVLLGVDDMTEQRRLFEELLHKKSTVRELKDRIAYKEPTPISQLNPEERYFERQLEERLGTSVKVTKEGSKGKVVIPFYSDQEFRALIDRILGEEKI